MECIKIDISSNISLNEFDNIINLIKSSLLSKGFDENIQMSCIIAMSVCNGETNIPITISIGEG